MLIDDHLEVNMLSCWCSNKTSQKINKDLRIHPLGIIDICAKFHVNQSDNSRVDPCMAINTVCATD